MMQQAIACRRIQRRSCNPNHPYCFQPAGEHGPEELALQNHVTILEQRVRLLQHLVRMKSAARAAADASLIRHSAHPPAIQCISSGSSSRRSQREKEEDEPQIVAEVRTEWPAPVAALLPPAACDVSIGTDDMQAVPSEQIEDQISFADAPESEQHHSQEKELPEESDEAEAELSPSLGPSSLSSPPSPTAGSGTDPSVPQIHLSLIDGPTLAIVVRLMVLSHDGAAACDLEQSMQPLAEGAGHGKAADLQLLVNTVAACEFLAFGRGVEAASAVLCSVCSPAVFLSLFSGFPSALVASLLVRASPLFFFQLVFLQVQQQQQEEQEQESSTCLPGQACSKKPLIDAVVLDHLALDGSAFRRFFRVALAERLERIKRAEEEGDFLALSSAGDGGAAEPFFPSALLGPDAEPAMEYLLSFLQLILGLDGRLPAPACYGNPSALIAFGAWGAQSLSGDLFTVYVSKVCALMAATATLSSHAEGRRHHRLNLCGCAEVSEESFLRSLVPSCAMEWVRHLNLNGCCAGVTDRVFSEALFPSERSLPNLEILELAGCNQLTDSAFVRCGPFFPPCRLSALNLHGCTRLGDAFLSHLSASRSAGSATGGLQDLCLYGCYRVTDAGLIAIATGLPQLRRLNVCGAYRITDNVRRYMYTAMPTLIFYNSNFTTGSGQSNSSW